jgi:hypothetical protein
MEAAEQDGSDAAGGGRSHLTGVHRQPPGTTPMYSYVENSRDTPHKLPSTRRARSYYY